MRGKLELAPKNIYNWIKLIFGKKQKYKDNKKGLLFNPISYVSFDDDFGREFDKATIGAIEFGLVPIQTIFKDYDYEKEKLREKQIFKTAVKDLIQNSKDYYYFINLNNKNINKSKNNKEYLFEDNKKNKIKIIGNEFGKVEIYINNIFIKEYYDHKDMITYIHYNKKLNMFVTTSLDGYAYIYSFPNKLLSVRKSPYNSYFDFAFLGANPFPFIFTYVKKKEIFITYSLNGIYIQSRQIILPNYKEFKVFPLLDTNGGLYNDAFIYSYADDYYYFDLPLFRIPELK